MPFLRRAASRLPTPIEHRIQRLVSRQRCAAALQKQSETTLEQRLNPTNAMRGSTTGREFNGKWNAIELAANPGDDQPIDVTQRGAIAARRGALHEKLGGRIREHVRRG